MKIQLKRSNVLDGGSAKAPTAGQMEYGELAVNYNTADPVLFIKDSADGIIRLTNNNDEILEDITEITDDIEAIQGLLPDPINGSDFQPDTLDVRYVSRFSWSDIPALPETVTP